MTHVSKRTGPTASGDSAPARKGDPGDVAGNMLATLVGNFFPPLAMLVSAPILAQSLGVDGRGEVAAATAPLTLIITAATFGIPDAVQYVVARSPAALRHATRTALALIVLAGLAATAAVILAAGWLSDGNATIERLIVVASLAIVPSLVVAVLRGSASGLHQWRRVSTERFISALIRVLALIPLALTGSLTPTTAVIVIAVGPLLGVVAYWNLKGPDIPQDGAHEPVSAKQILGFGGRVWVGAISGILLSRVDQVLMTPLSSAYQLGLYAVAATIADIPLIINRAVRDVTFSADAADATDARLGTSARISSTASALLGLVTGVTMIWWLPWLFGDDFSPAIPITAVLLLAAVLGTPGSIAGAGLSARGRPGLRSSSLVVACVINVALVIVLVPHYGAMGAAVATLVGSLIAANANIFFLWKIFGMSPREFYGFRRDDLKVAIRFGRRMMKKVFTR
jgi:O-antigen/teichoic acid export membrane protein